MAVLIYNHEGKRVREVYEYYNFGMHQIGWDGKDTNGSDLPAGTYYVTIHSGKFSKVEKVIRMK